MVRSIRSFSAAAALLLFSLSGCSPDSAEVEPGAEPRAEVPTPSATPPVDEPLAAADVSFGDTPAGFDVVATSEAQPISRDEAKSPAPWTAGPYKLVQSEEAWVSAWRQISTEAALPVVNFANTAVIVVRHKAGAQPVKPWVVEEGGNLRVVLDAASIDAAGQTEGGFFYYEIPLGGGYVSSVSFN